MVISLSANRAASLPPFVILAILAALFFAGALPAVAEDHYAQLVTLFEEFREFVPPEVIDDSKPCSPKWLWMRGVTSA